MENERTEAEPAGRESHPAVPVVACGSTEQQYESFEWSEGREGNQMGLPIQADVVPKPR